MSHEPIPADIIVVEGTGDLALHKLLPALHHLDRAGQLAADTRISGSSPAYTRTRRAPLGSFSMLPVARFIRVPGLPAMERE